MGGDPRWAEQALKKNNTDITLALSSQFLDRRLRLDLGVGMHRESYNEESPYAELNSANQFEWHNFGLYELEGIPGCAPNAAGFNPCPVDNYHNGGYGLLKEVRRIPVVQ